MWEKGAEMNIDSIVEEAIRKCVPKKKNIPDVYTSMPSTLNWKAYYTIPWREGYNQCIDDILNNLKRRNEK